MMKTTKRALLAVSLLSLMATGAARAADDVIFQLDWTPGGISAAWYLGLEKGCFTDQGINLTITRGYGAADAVTKIATGVSQFGITDLSVIIASASKADAPVKAIMPVVPVSPVGIAVLDSSPIKTLKDLEGRSIGSSAGNAAMELLPIGLEMAGADMAKVKIITAEPSTLTGLLLQGQVDSLGSYVTSVVGMQAVADKVGKKLRAISYGPDLNIYNASVFTSDKMIADNPDLVARFVKASECTFDAAVANPDAAIDAMVARVEGMQKATQVTGVPFSLDFAFNNPVFKANGYKWDLARVANNIAITNKVHSLPEGKKPEDFVYVVPQ